MTDSHGVAIICEMASGHTVAWEDADIARHVPYGWFIEWWPRRHRCYAGRLGSMYVMQRFPSEPNTRRHWMDWADAAAWCEAKANRRAA